MSNFGDHPAGFFGVSGFYNGVINQSLRLNVGSDYKLDRQMVTPTSVTGTICTASWWMKKSAHGTVQSYIQCRDNQASGEYAAYWSYGTDGSSLSGTDSHSFRSGGSETILVGTLTGGYPYRDTSGWYHVVIRYDSTQSTAADRIRIYKNGQLQNSEFTGTTYPSQNAVETYWNNAGEHLILFGNGEDSGDSFDGYIAEFNWVDGQSLAPETFGESKNGVWIPKAITLSTADYGLNGCRYTFSDSSDIGKDSSGVGNDLDRVSGFAASDVVPDSPENNFCTLNSLILTPQTTFSEGNLFANLGATHKTVHGTFGMTTGKWYWEARAFDGGANKFTYGLTDTRNISNLQVSGTNYLVANTANTYANGDAVSIYHDSLYKNGSATGSYNTAIGDNDIVGIAFDADAGKVWFHREGTWINGSATASTTINLSNHDTTVTTGQTYHIAFAGETSDWLLNAGQDSSFAGTETAQGNTDSNGIGDFYYSPPSGFLAVCSNNLPDTTIGPNSDTQATDYFKTVLYTGNGTGQTISGVGFQPDWTWNKNLQATDFHILQDSSRGAGKEIFTNSSADEESYDNSITSWNTDGFVLGSREPINANNEAYVSWNWKANGGTTTTNDASSTSVGATDSVIQANTDAGFSIVTYTGTGSATTIAHGLGGVPEVMIIKNRTGGDHSWAGFYHHLMAGSAAASATDYLSFDSASTLVDDATIWNDTAPTSTVFTVGSANNTGASKDYVGYFFRGIEGYSKFGAYIANGNADGPVVFTGFRPQLVIVKNTASAFNWPIVDDTRGGVGQVYKPNPIVSQLIINGTAAEFDSPSYPLMDFLSNGFKLRLGGTGSTVAQNVNRASGQLYIYLAFAHTPFKYANSF